MYDDVAKSVLGFGQKIIEGFADICMMPSVVSKHDLVLRVQDRDFYSCGTDIDSKGIIF